ncbi:MAG: hypothetical protein KGS45_00900 [Planctomycetes bacterium]|nr:hypothetical protein [Planctomycetota bacterium]
MKRSCLSALALLALAGSLASAQVTGPNAGAPPYMLPSDGSSGTIFVSIATNGRGGANVDPDITYPKLGGGVYRLWGLVDGAGAFRDADDLANNTFSFLVNHEVGSGSGGVKGHGANGTTVSLWKIKADATDLQVIGGKDLMTNVLLWDTTTNAYVAGSPSLGRFCAAELAAPSAFRFGSLGTDERIFLNGEETGANGRAFAHIATGPNAGTTYELPSHGDYSWENNVASPFPQAKTVVIGADDSTPGNVFVFVGNKQSTGTEIERAGLTGGTVYAIGMSGTTVNGSGQNEESATNILGNAVSGPVASKAFTMINMGDLTNVSGATLQSSADAQGQMNFNRPEDLCWDTRNPNVAYFLTTASFNGNSRLWKMEFTDITLPQLGGTITMLLDGNDITTASGGFTSATGATQLKMMDNIGITRGGILLIQEDPGNNARLARMWAYDIYADSVVEVGISSSNYFVTGAPSFLTQDEETSGVLEAWDILGPGWTLLDMQAHYSITANGLSEGGQLLAAYIPAAKRLCQVDINSDSIVDFFDYLDFVSAFSSNARFADFNLDGVIDFFDYLDFVAAFSTGC